MTMQLAAALPADKKNLLEDYLLPGESVMAFASFTPFIYWKTIVTFIAALILLPYAFNLFLYVGFIGLVLLALAVSARKYLLLAVTDQRVIINGGIISNNLIQFSYDKIESLWVSRLMLGQLFGYGSLIISGTGKQRIIVPYVENVFMLEQLIAENIRQRRRQDIKVE